MRKLEVDLSEFPLSLRFYSIRDDEQELSASFSEDFSLESLPRLRTPGSDCYVSG